MNVHGIKYVTLFYVAVKALLAKCLLSGPFDALLCYAYACGQLISHFPMTLLFSID